MVTSSSDGSEYSLSAVFRNTIKRLSARKGIVGVIICDREGFTLGSNLPTEQSETISANIGILISRVLDVVAASGKYVGELQTFTVFFEGKQLLISPDLERGFTVVLLKEKVS